MDKKSNHSGSDLKGTLISVFIVGIIICVMWFAVYGLYISR